MTRDKKILIKNIYYMLAYAFSSLSQTGYENVEKEEFDNIHNMFAAILSRGVNLQLKHGLYKEYVTKTEDLSVIRGKIDINGTIKNKISRKPLATCEFDDLSEDNQLNQIVKTTILLLLKSPDVDNSYRKDLKRAWLFFSTINVIESPNQIRWSAIRFQRDNQSYRLLICVCQLIIEGMIITTDKGEYKLASFVNEQKMWYLYQNFILEYYKKHFPELKAHSPQIPWDMPDGTPMGLLPAMQTDIVLRGKVKTLVIDAKYYSNSSFQKRCEKETFVSGNMYQIYTYVKNMDKERTGDVSGMLIYAKTEEETEPKGEYLMGGNRISVDYIDLNVEFEYIREKLDGIVERELVYYEKLVGLSNSNTI